MTISISQIEFPLRDPSENISCRLEVRILTPTDPLRDPPVSEGYEGGDVVDEF